MTYTLGRLHAADSRDNSYLIKDKFADVRTESIHKSKYWWCDGWHGNQKDIPACCGYAWTHWLEDGPVTRKGNRQFPIIDPDWLYYQAQDVDEWPGSNYAGTSVRAVAKVLRHMGFVANYYWAFDNDTLIDTVQKVGPVVVGTNWYRQMGDPDGEGIVHVAGRLDGGHSYVINGIDYKREMFRAKNSWGREFGRNGLFYIPIDEFERLIKEDGEICLATEVGKLNIAEDES